MGTYISDLDEKIIIVNIVDALVDLVSIQPDIDIQKSKSAELLAQDLDLVRLIGKENVDRCITPVGTADNELLALIIKPLCFFTYSRLLKSFPGTFTDSGYTVEEGASTINEVKGLAAYHATVAEGLMKPVFDFLKLETPEGDVNVVVENVNPRIRVFGGKETRSSN